MPSPGLLRPPPPAADSQRALRHYERAIAALRSAPYRDMPPALRTDLLRRLQRERDALLDRTGAQPDACLRVQPLRDAPEAAGR